jgi:hypothetical protein
MKEIAVHHVSTRQSRASLLPNLDGQQTKVPYAPLLPLSHYPLHQTRWLPLGN